MNGAEPTTSPGREQRGALAVINHVSGRARCLPPVAHGTGGGRLSPHIIEAAPAFPPRRMRRAVLPRVRRRNMTVAVSPGSRRDTTPALGFAGGGGLFQFCLTARQLGGDLRGEERKRLPVIGSLHGFNHEAVDEQEVGRVVQGRGNVQ